MKRYTNENYWEQVNQLYEIESENREYDCNLTKDLIQPNIGWNIDDIYYFQETYFSYGNNSEKDDFSFILNKKWYGKRYVNTKRKIYWNQNPISENEFNQKLKELKIYLKTQIFD